MIAIKWRWTRKPVQWSWLARGRAFSLWLPADKKPPYPHPPSPKFNDTNLSVGRAHILPWPCPESLSLPTPSDCYSWKLSKWPWKGSGWGSGQAPLTRAFAGSKPHPTAPLPVPVRTVLRPGSRGPNPRRGASDGRSEQARLPKSVPPLTRTIPWAPYGGPGCTPVLEQILHRSQNRQCLCSKWKTTWYRPSHSSPVFAIGECVPRHRGQCNVLIVMEGNPRGSPSTFAVCDQK